MPVEVTRQVWINALQTTHLITALEWIMSWHFKILCQRKQIILFQIHNNEVTASNQMRTICKRNLSYPSLKWVLFIELTGVIPRFYDVPETQYRMFECSTNYAMSKFMLVTTDFRTLYCVAANRPNDQKPSYKTWNFIVIQAPDSCQKSDGLLRVYPVAWTLH